MNCLKRIVFTGVLLFFQLYFAQQEKTFKHLVQENESLESIANKYKVAINDILFLNQGAEKGITPYSVLVIPNVNSISYLFKKNDVLPQQYTKYQVNSHDTLYGIAQQYHLTVEQLKKANPTLETISLQEGMQLQIPLVTAPYQNQVIFDGKWHQVQSQDNLYSIARMYNVAVKDLDELNASVLINGLKIGQKIEIPTKKKSISGQARIINTETLFHVVQPKETKFSISKKYNISIEQLEKQNPEIINGLIIGNKLAINTSNITAKNEKEELMIALAEKQAVVEKAKAQVLKIEDLEDRLKVQKELNKKMITLNKLNIDLGAIDETKNGSVERLRLIYEANKKIQEVLMAKLDSVVVTLEYDLLTLKEKEVESVEESKKIEKKAIDKTKETTKLVTEIKQNLAENKKVFIEVLHKIQRLTLAEQQEYKYRTRYSLTHKDQQTVKEINNYNNTLQTTEAKQNQVLTKIQSLDQEKNNLVKRKIAKATFYSEDARMFDDQLALAKLQRIQNTIPPETIPPGKENLIKHNASFTTTHSVATKIEVIEHVPDLLEGYYLVVKTFTDTLQRDALTLKLSHSGERNTKFFFNVNNFQYYIYTNYFKTLEEALFESKVKPKIDVFNELFIVQIKKQ